MGRDQVHPAMARACRPAAAVDRRDAVSKKLVKIPKARPLGFPPGQPACIGVDPERFFPIGDQDVDPEAADACAACPPAIRARCLDYAIEAREWGYWGGTTREERDVLLRRSQRAALAAAKRDGAGLGAEGEPDGEAAA